MTRYIEFEHETGKVVQARVIRSLFNGKTLEVGWLDRSGRTMVPADKVRTISAAAATADPSSPNRAF